MKILLLGLAIFFIAFILHLIIWRMPGAKISIRSLLRIFAGALVMVFALLWVGSFLIAELRRISPSDFLEYLQTALFYIALFLSYAFTYSAIEASSPSIVIILEIAKNGKRGMRKNDFENMMSDEILVKPRIEDLLNDKLISKDGDRYRILPAGSMFVRPFIFYRTLLNLGKGG